MDYEIIGKLIFGQQRLKAELALYKPSGAETESAEWAAMLADVEAADLAIAALQQPQANISMDGAEAALAHSVRARAAFEGLRC